MKNFHKIGLSAVLAAGLLGCQAQLPLVSQLQDKASVDGQATAAPVVSAGDLPKVNLVSQQGQVTITIKWPERQIQAIPTSTNTIRIRFTPSEGDAISDVIARDPMNPTVTRSYNLKQGVTYAVEVKAYQQLAAAVTANGDSLTAIATGTDSISVGADETKPLSITLVPLYQPVLTPATYVAGDGARLQITGSGFGTNPADLMVYYTNSSTPLAAQNYERTELPIVTMSDTVIAVDLPANCQWNGKLVVKRDGVPATNSGTNQVVFYRVNNINTHFENALLKFKDSKYYAIEDIPFTIPVKAWANNTETSNFQYSVAVKDMTTDADVTGTVYSNGQFTLPTGKHRYQVTFKTGSVEQTTAEIYASTLNWGSNPLCMAPTAPYYINETMRNDDQWDANATSGVVSLANFSLTSSAGAIPLDKEDFTWGYSPDNLITLFSEWNTSGKVRFKGVGDAGDTTVTGTLRYNVAKSFTSTVKNVRMNSLIVKQDSNNDSTYDPLPGGTISLTVGQKYRLKGTNLALSNGQTVTADYNRLSWSSRDPNNSENYGDSIATVGKPWQGCDFVEVEGVSPGTVEIWCQYTPETDPTKIKKITFVIN